MKRRYRFLLLAAAILVLMAGTAWWQRTYVLSAIANLWIVNMNPEHADAIVILGGGEQYRSFKAAALYRDGMAPVILIPKINLLPTEELAITESSNDVNKRVLISQGVPETAIQLIGSGDVKNTRDEASKVAAWILEHHAHSVIVPTDAFHTRRCSWIFHRTLSPLGVQAYIVCTPSSVNPSNWWTNEEGVIAFENEVCKMIYYWLKY